MATGLVNSTATCASYPSEKSRPKRRPSDSNSDSVMPVRFRDDGNLVSKFCVNTVKNISELWGASYSKPFLVIYEKQVPPDLGEIYMFLVDLCTDFGRTLPRARFYFFQWNRIDFHRTDVVLSKRFSLGFYFMGPVLAAWLHCPH